MTYEKHIYLSGKGVRQHMLSKKLKLVVSGIVAAVIVAATISTSYAATIYTQNEAGARYTRYATYNTFTMAAGGPAGGSLADRGTYGMFRGDGLTDSSAVPVRTDVHYYNDDGSSALDWYNSNFVYCIHNRKLSPSATYYPEIGFGSVPAYVNSAAFQSDSAMKDAVTRNGVLIILQNGFPVTDFGMPRDDAYSATAMAIRFWMAERERDLNASGVWTYLWNYNVYDVSRSGSYGSIAAISSYATLARNQAALSQAHALLGLARQAKSGYGTRAPSTLSASGGSAYISGDNFVFTTALNYSNLDRITWDHTLPAGSNIYRDGNTLVVTVPKSVSYANKSYSVRLSGYDRAHVNNFVFAPITTNNAYQALVGIKSQQSQGPIVESALTISTPSIETDLVPSIRTYSMKTGAKVYTNTFEPGERVYVELITTNTDAPTAYNFSNWWSWRNNATGTGYDEFAATVSALAGYGNTHVVAKSYVPPIRDASYTSTIGYQVDYNDAVPERNNSVAQNTASHTVTIKGRPNLNVTQVRTIDASSNEQNSYNPSVVAADRKVRAGIVVRNNGASTSAATTATLTLNGVTKTVNIPAIASGGTATVYVAAASAHDTPTPDVTTNYTVTGTVAAGQTYSGSRTASKTISVIGKPDLIVSELTTDKDTYEAGEKVTVKARVKNEGGSTAGSSVLRIAPTGLTAAQVTVPALAAGASSQEYTFSFTAMTALTNTQVTVLATADYSKQVTEGNENNNTKSKVITVLALKPDLTFGNTHNILNTYYAGKDIVFSVQVRNLTAQPVPSVKVKLTLGDRTVTESLPVPGLGTNVAVFRIKTPESIGSYPVQLYIDPLNEIAERLPDGELNNDRNETGTLLFDGSAASVKLSTANPIRTDMPDPETEEMEAAHLWRNKAVPELPDLDGSIYHTWSEIRYVSGSYVTRNYWARLTTELSINPDPRVAIKDSPGVMESGFGIQAFVNTTIETNYDRPDKLVGTQMHWMYYPETLYYDGLDGVIYGDDLETTSVPGSLTNRASYRLSPYTVTGQHLHYTPVWFPDGNYEVLGQSFYAWSPAGQMYEQQSASVEISGDMYDRVPVLNW